MRRRSPPMLGKVLGRLGRVSPACHRDLVRGMVAELDSVADGSDHARFAAGAIVAIARLTLREWSRATVDAACAFTTHYVSLVAGEVLADRQIVSPSVAMWLANTFLIAVVLLLLWRPEQQDGKSGSEALAIHG